MIIGITTTLNAQDGFERVNAEYISRVADAGATPILLPPVPGGREENAIAAHRVIELLDALIVAGGGDIDPTLFGQIALPETTLVSRIRDEFELALVSAAHERGLPTLGICRGMQVMNVALGGSLYQDLYACGITEVQHRQDPPYHTTNQRVDVAEGSLLSAILCENSGIRNATTSTGNAAKPLTARGMTLGCQEGWPAALEVGRDCVEGRVFPLRVNSMHHQAIERIASNLLVSAVSPDGIIEALEDPTCRFFLGVQWHPEYLDDHTLLFEALVRAAARR